MPNEREADQPAKLGGVSSSVWPSFATIAAPDPLSTSARAKGKQRQTPSHNPTAPPSGRSKISSLPTFTVPTTSPIASSSAKEQHNATDGPARKKPRRSGAGADPPATAFSPITSGLPRPLVLSSPDQPRHLLTSKLPITTPSRAPPFPFALATTNACSPLNPSSPAPPKTSVPLRPPAFDPLPSKASHASPSTSKVARLPPPMTPSKPISSFSLLSPFALPNTASPPGSSTGGGAQQKPLMQLSNLGKGLDPLKISSNGGGILAAGQTAGAEESEEHWQRRMFGLDSPGAVGGGGKKKKGSGTDSTAASLLFAASQKSISRFHAASLAYKPPSDSSSVSAKSTATQPRSQLPSSTQHQHRIALDSPDVALQILSVSSISPSPFAPVNTSSASLLLKTRCRILASSFGSPLKRPVQAEPPSSFSLAPSSTIVGDGEDEEEEEEGTVLLRVPLVQYPNGRELFRVGTRVSGWMPWLEVAIQGPSGGGREKVLMLDRWKILAS